jgi:hypothetical protein
MFGNAFRASERATGPIKKGLPSNSSHIVSH